MFFRKPTGTHLHWKSGLATQKHHSLLDPLDCSVTLRNRQHSGEGLKHSLQIGWLQCEGLFGWSSYIIFFWLCTIMMQALLPGCGSSFPGLINSLLWCLPLVLTIYTHTNREKEKTRKKLCLYAKRPTTHTCAQICNIMTAAKLYVRLLFCTATIKFSFVQLCQLAPWPLKCWVWLWKISTSERCIPITGTSSECWQMPLVLQWLQKTPQGHFCSIKVIMCSITACDHS